MEHTRDALVAIYLERAFFGGGGKYSCGGGLGDVIDEASTVACCVDGEPGEELGWFRSGRSDDSPVSRLNARVRGVTGGILPVGGAGVMGIMLGDFKTMSSHSFKARFSSRRSRRFSCSSLVEKQEMTLKTNSAK